MKTEDLRGYRNAWRIFSVDVRRNWQTCHTDLRCNCGFPVTCGNTCMFGHQERDIVVMVYADDFVS